MIFDVRSTLSDENRRENHNSNDILIGKNSNTGSSPHIYNDIDPTP